MSRSMFAIVLAAGLTACARPPTPRDVLKVPPQCPQLVVRFSPATSASGGCAAQLVALIASAQHTIRQTAYSYTSIPVMEAMLAAHARGVDTQVLVDPTSRLGTVAQTLVARGVPVFVDAKHAIFHSKTLAVDGLRVETGSYNYTRAAEQANSENCLFVDGAPDIAAQYAADWELHRAHSTPLAAMKVRADADSELNDRSADYFEGMLEPAPVPNLGGGYVPVMQSPLTWPGGVVSH